MKSKKANYILFAIIMIFLCYVMKAFKPEFDVNGAIGSITGLTGLLVSSHWHLDYFSMKKGLQKKEKK